VGALLILALIVLAALAYRRRAANYVAGSAGANELGYLSSQPVLSELDYTGDLESDVYPIRLPDGSVLEYHGDPALIPDITDADGIPVPLAPARPRVS